MRQSYRSREVGRPLEKNDIAALRKCATLGFNYLHAEGKQRAWISATEPTPPEDASDPFASSEGRSRMIAVDFELASWDGAPEEEIASCHEMVYNGDEMRTITRTLREGDELRLIFEKNALRTGAIDALCDAKGNAIVADRMLLEVTRGGRKRPVTDRYLIGTYFGPDNMARMIRSS